MQVTAGTLDAPVGPVTAAYLYAPSAARLAMDLPGISDQCIAIFHKVSESERSGASGLIQEPPPSATE